MKNNQLGCDHIIGYFQNWDGFDERLLQSEFLSEIVDDRLRDYEPGKKKLAMWNRIADKFYFCPKKDCGDPIDWKAIEKQINQNKDD